MTSTQTLLAGHAEGTTVMPGTRMIRLLRAYAFNDHAIREALMRELAMTDAEARAAIVAYDAEVVEERRRRLD